MNFRMKKNYLKTIKFPTGIAHLDSGLADMNWKTFPHFDEFFWTCFAFETLKATERNGFVSRLNSGICWARSQKISKKFWFFEKYFDYWWNWNREKLILKMKNLILSEFSVKIRKFFKLFLRFFWHFYHILNNFEFDLGA